MACCDAFAEHQHGGAVNGRSLGEGVEAAFEREGEAGAVAERFFLREGAF